MLLTTVLYKATTAVVASALAVGAVAGLSYAAEATLEAQPSSDVLPTPSVSPSPSGAPAPSAGPVPSGKAAGSARPAPEKAPSAGRAVPAPSASAGPAFVRASVSNVRVTANDGVSLTVDGTSWALAEEVKVNLRGSRASVADVLVGMRVHLKGWSEAGALTVAHVVVPSSPENRALQAAAGHAAPKGTGRPDKADRAASRKAHPHGTAPGRAKPKKAKPGSPAGTPGK